MILVNGADVRWLLPMADAVDLMRATYRAFSDGQVEQPVRHMVRSPAGDVLAVMPAHVAAGEGVSHEGFGLKAVAINPGNAARGLPVHTGLVLVFDPDTGVPCALLSGAAITAVRTAAATAAATDVLARKDASRLAILGSGVQARTHLEAMAVVRELDDIRVWNHRRATAEAFAKWADKTLCLAVTVCETAQEAAAEADVICTVTASSEPVLQSADVADGTHISAVGSSFAGARELAGDLVGRTRVFVDSFASARAESGDLLKAADEGYFSLADIRAEIGQVIAGSATGRSMPEEVTLFKSLGLAAQDVVSGFEVYRRALACGIGIQVDFSDSH